MKDERIYLRINPLLKERMRQYASKRHTTLSDLVTDYLVRLLEEEAAEERALVEVPQV